MMNYGYGYGGSQWGLWILMMVAMVVFWGALAWIIVTLLRHREMPAGTLTIAPGAETGPPIAADGVRILNERLARGEIDEDEYKRRRVLIKGTP